MDYESKSRGNVTVSLEAHPERRLLRPTGSKRYIAFLIHVEKNSPAKEAPRPALKLSLVLDRSGSMAGEKVRMAKRAALAVLDQLTTRDNVSLVIFDDKIDTIQSLAPVTPQLKDSLRRKLDEIDARGSTALHEGWLTGCNTIAGRKSDSPVEGLARCFLLTDGIANVGVTDPERIATEAAGVLEHAGISTSTFGIGTDYNELLLGPMAVAGGGQFHHLRTADEILNTFVGELGELFSVVARKVRLEILTESGVNLDLVSPYWMRSEEGEQTRWSIAIGDLAGEDERPVVVQCAFPAQKLDREQSVVHTRLTWVADDTEQASAWQEIVFTYASQNACDDEPQDIKVMEIVSKHEADRARREAIEKNKQGDYAGAKARIQATSVAFQAYAPASPIVQEEMQELNAFNAQMPAAAPMAPGMTKEVYYKQQSRSRAQKDLRNTKESTPAEPDPKEKGKFKLPWQSDKDEK
jgi:Ca-activated chloride channel family protein